MLLSLFLAPAILGRQKPAPVDVGACFGIYGEVASPGAYAVGEKGVSIEEAFERYGAKPSAENWTVGSRQVVVCRLNGSVETCILPDSLVLGLPAPDAPPTPSGVTLRAGDFVYVPARSEAVILDGTEAYYLLYDEPVRAAAKAASAPNASALGAPAENLPPEPTLDAAYRMAQESNGVPPNEETAPSEFLVIPNALARIQVPNLRDKDVDAQKFGLGAPLFPGAAKPFIVSGEDLGRYRLSDGDLVIAHTAEKERANDLYQTLLDACVSAYGKVEPTAPKYEVGRTLLAVAPAAQTACSLAFGRFYAATDAPKALSWSSVCGVKRWRAFSETPLGKTGMDLPGRLSRNDVVFFRGAAPNAKTQEKGKVERYDLLYESHDKKIRERKPEPSFGDFRAIYRRHPLFSTNLYLYADREKEGSPEAADLLRVEYRAAEMGPKTDPETRGGKDGAVYYCHPGLFPERVSDYKAVPIDQDDKIYIHASKRSRWSWPEAKGSLYPSALHEDAPEVRKMLQENVDRLRHRGGLVIRAGARP